MKWKEFHKTKLCVLCLPILTCLPFCNSTFMGQEPVWYLVRDKERVYVLAKIPQLVPDQWLFWKGWNLDISKMTIPTLQ